MSYDSQSDVARIATLAMEHPIYLPEMLRFVH